MGGVFSSKRKDADDLSKLKNSNNTGSSTNKRSSQKVTPVAEQGGQGFKKSVLSVLLLGTGETGMYSFRIATS